MAQQVHTYESAVEKLDEFIQSKTSHSTKSILQAMQIICDAPFLVLDDEQDFQNDCSNFDKYVQHTGITSIGRKQFEQWWELQPGHSVPEIVHTPEPEPPSKKDELKELLKELFISGEIEIEVSHQSNRQHGSTTVSIIIDGELVATDRG